MKIRTELKKNYKELYDVLKKENLLLWFEKCVKYYGDIDLTIIKLIQIIDYHKKMLVDSK